MADVSGGNNCESCAIASRIRLGLALYRAGVADPFGEIDRDLRNQPLENQFTDVSFLPPLQPEIPRTDRAAYAGIDQMIRGTFQCWATANDLIGSDEIEGCGAGGGVQGIALAWNAQAEWRTTADGQELCVHLLFNRTIPAAPGVGLTSAAPVAAELWSHLPYEGRVTLRAHQPISRLALRLPDGSDLSGLKVRLNLPPGGERGSPEFRPQMEGHYAIIPRVAAGHVIDVQFPLKRYETVECAAGTDYRVQWRGSAVLGISPTGKKVPLCRDRDTLANSAAPLSNPRYPR